MNEVLKPLLWTALGVESVLAVAILLATLHAYWRERRRVTPDSGLANWAIGLVDQQGGRSKLKDPIEGYSIRTNWIKTVRKRCPPLGDCLRVLLDDSYGQHRDEAVQLTLQDHVGAGKNLAAFIIRTAALFGLALTFVGIIDALAVFEIDSTNISGLTRGFYTSLTSTILGIVATVITLVGFMAHRRLDSLTTKRVQLAILKLDHWLHDADAEPVVAWDGAASPQPTSEPIKTTTSQSQVKPPPRSAHPSGKSTATPAGPPAGHRDPPSVAASHSSPMEFGFGEPA